ncbi:MAG: leucine-rich repeat domain-containing protein [Clostridia bacterium]|nr:leucine-rich repeat domain-containing protein [Clostridia bacterium]
MDDIIKRLFIPLFAILVLFYGYSAAFCEEIIPSVAISAEKSTYLTGEEIAVHCSAPADYFCTLYLIQSEDESKSYVSSWFSKGGVETVTKTFSSAQTVSFHLETSFRGLQQDGADTGPIAVSAAYPAMEGTGINIPYQVDKGKDIRIEITPEEHARQYEFTFNDEFNFTREQYVYDVKQTDIGKTKTVVIPAKKLREGAYLINCFARGLGTEEDYYRYCWVHIGKVNNEMVISITPEDASIDEEISIYTYAPHAEEYIVYRLDKNDMRGIDRGPGGVDYEYTESFDSAQEATYFFEIRIGGQTYRKSATVRIADSGISVAPEITVPYRVPVGQDVSFSVAPMDQAQRYEITVEKLRGSNSWYRKDYDLYGAYTLPAEELSEGVYRITAQVYAPGYPLAKKTVYFHVGEKIDQTVAFYAESETVRLHDAIRLFANAPHAETLKIVCEDTGEEIAAKPWNADSWETEAEKPGKRAFLLEASYGDEIITKRVEITVLQPAEKLDTPQIEMTAKAAFHRDFNFHVSEVRCAERYHIRVWMNATGMLLDEHDETEIEYVGLYLFDLPYEGWCTVEVVARAAGYQDSDPAYDQFWLGADLPPDIHAMDTLTLPMGLKTAEKEVFLAVGAERIILPEGIQKIESRAFADCKELKYINLPDSLMEIAADAFEGCGKLYVECRMRSYAENIAINSNFHVIPQ